MRKESFRSALALIAIGGIGLAGPVSAEGMLDIYLGGSFTDTTNVDSAFLGAPLPFGNVEFNSFVAGGIRGGAWIDGFGDWLGIAADLSYFRAEVDSACLPGFGCGAADGLADFHTIPVTPLLMLRVPLLRKGDGRNPRLQPYFGIGPGLFTTIVDSDLMAETKVDFNVGLDLRVGLAGLVSEHFGFFVEYRRTQFTVSVKDSFDDPLKADLDTNHVNGGIALRF